MTGLGVRGIKPWVLLADKWLIIIHSLHTCIKWMHIELSVSVCMHVASQDSRKLAHDKLHFVFCSSN